VVAIDGKTTVLAEGGHTKCYTACVRHHTAAVVA
jgi:hypothetical protein